MNDLKRFLAFAPLALVGAVGCLKSEVGTSVTVNPVLIGPVRTIGGAPDPGWQERLGEPNVRHLQRSMVAATQSSTTVGHTRITTTTSTMVHSGGDIELDWEIAQAAEGDGRGAVGVQELYCSNWAFLFIGAVMTKADCQIVAKTTSGPIPAAAPLGPAMVPVAAPVPVPVPAAPVAPPPAAIAPSSGKGPDTVFLKNGGRLRGKVMSDEPTTVSIQLLDSTTRTLPRAEVERVEYAK